MLIAIFLLSAAASGGTAKHASPSNIEYAKHELAARGVPQAEVEAIFNDPRLRIEPKHKEGRQGLTRSEYRQMVLRDDSVQRGLDYLEMNRQAIRETLDPDGPPAEHIVGLFRMETNLGTYMTDQHRHRVVNVWYGKMLRSKSRGPAKNFVEAIMYCRQSPPKYILALQDASWRRPLMAALSDRNDDGQVDLFDRWSDIHEQAFRTILEQKHLDYFALTGSFEGAYGIGQFLPITVKTDGVDGNHDGRIDLFDPADATASTKHFLKRTGHPGTATGSQEAKVARSLARYLGSPKRAPWRRFGNYADLILAYSEQLHRRLLFLTAAAAR